MYQSIDDTEPNEFDAAPRRRLLLPLILLTAAILAIFAFVFTQSPGRPATSAETITDTKARAAYLQAISEPTAALRRARLQDFQRIHPTNPHASRAGVQLAQINAHEMREWERAVRIAYMPKLTREEKLDALAVYAGRWNPDLLGGRSEAFVSLQAEVNGMENLPDRPDRRLVEGKSVIPESINGNELAGGPAPIAPPPQMATFLPKPEAPKLVQQEIIGPKIRRNVQPRYPRKALRRKVDGVVTLSINIGADGKVAMTEVMDVKADRYQKDFIKAAERAAMRTRFHPKTIDGEAVPAVGVLKRYRFESGQ